jgi:polyisoprenoid-binding protein YceI
MKRILPSILAVVVVVGLAIFLFGSPAESPTTEKTATTSATDDMDAEIPAGQYTVSTSTSAVNWTARKKLVDGYADTGVIPIKSGTITQQATGTLKADIVLRLDEIRAGSVANDKAPPSRLTQHLRSEDFFATSEYPTGTIAVKGTEPIASTTKKTDYTVTADVTMKGNTNTVTFPAKIGTKADQLNVQANMTIDRTRWGIRYGSDSFFDNLGDNVIEDDVDISVALRAEKSS